MSARRRPERERAGALKGGRLGRWCGLPWANPRSRTYVSKSRTNASGEMPTEAVNAGVKSAPARIALRSVRTEVAP